MLPLRGKSSWDCRFVGHAHAQVSRRTQDLPVSLKATMPKHPIIATTYFWRCKYNDLQCNHQFSSVSVKYASLASNLTFAVSGVNCKQHWSSNDNLLGACMPNGLMGDLVGKPQRETAGADTASRFDYQKDWAFCQMVRKHIDGVEYLIAFEFHDDVVFVEPGDTDEKVDFYQVKTSRSPKAKTLSSLLSRKKGANSILGKMYQNFDGICQDTHVRTVLVSNVAFDFSAADICADDLEQKKRQRIIDKLTEEFPALDGERLKKMHFVVTGVSIDAMSSFLHGEVAELFRHELGEDHGINIHSWVRLVQGEIRRKNNFDSSNIKAVSELVSNKCIAKNFIAESIDYVAKQKTTPPDMGLVNSELKDAGWINPVLMKIGKRLPVAASDHSDATNREVAEVAEVMDGLLSTEANPDLPNFLTKITTHFSKSSKTADVYSDTHYLWALAIIVYYEKI